MKYIFTALLSGFLVQICSAQITIQSGDLPVAPIVFNNGVDTMPSGVIVGPAGANQTWDYSTVDQDITETATHQTAAASGYSGTFPTATNAVTPDGSSYGFFRNTGTAFVGQGLAGDLLNNGSTLEVQFSPTFDLYRFPTQYGGAFSGTYGFQKSVSGSSVGQPVNQVRITFVSDYTDDIDGYGTVTTPLGTYNCLRQKRVEYTDTKIEAKLFSFSSWSNVDRIYDTTTTYNYLALETEGPVVTLAVNKQGGVSRVTYSLIPPAPVADFTANNPYGGLVNFTDTSTNSPATYSWTFGDGGTSTDANPDHTYAANGTYNVCLTVTNVTGTDTYCQNVTVDGIFTTNIAGQATACSNQASALTYNVPNTSGHTYTWTPTGGVVTSGAGTNSVTVNWNGSAPYGLQLTECEQTGNYCVTDTKAFTMLPVAITNLTQTICAGESYLGFSSTGIYNDTSTAANGCDSIFSLDLTVLPNSGSTITTTICYGDTLLGYTASGVYYDTLTAANTCDSVRVLDLTVRPQNLVTLTNTICAGDTLEGYTTSGIYTDNFTDQYGCDSTRTLNLTVRPANVTNLNVFICPGNSYEGYTTAGTYTDMFTDRYGCDSTRTVVLALQSSIRDTVYRQECFGGSYYGYTTTDTYVDTFSSSNCDSIRVLYLTILPLSQQTVTQTICQGESFEGYTTGGNFTDNFTNSNGCDSTRTLELTVLPNASNTIDTTICYNTTFEGYGATATYYDTLTAANTCDSVRIINLVVLPQNLTNISQTICQGDSYLGYTTTGLHTDLYTAANGCDSTRVLDLTVLPAVSTTIDTIICFNTSFEGYDTTGTYFDTLTAANTCDSIRIINLTVLPQNLVTLNETICEGDSFEGFTTSNTYTDTLTGGNGCDSIRILNLTVTPMPVTSASVSICDGDSVLLGGQWRTTDGTYTDTTSNGACLAATETVLTVNALPTTPVITSSDDTLTSSVDDAAAYYWYLDGSIVDSTSGAQLVSSAEGSYELTVLNSDGCAATSTPFNLIISSIQQVGLADQYSIYPNPTTGKLFVQNNSTSSMQVQVYNAVGGLVAVELVQQGVSLLDLSTADQGIYFVRVTMGGTTEMQKVVLTR